MIVIVAFDLTTGTWFDSAPHLRRAPLYFAAMAIALPVVNGAGKLGIPRWSFTASNAAVAFGCVIAGAYFFCAFRVA